LKVGQLLQKSRHCDPKARGAYGTLRRVANPPTRNRKRRTSLVVDTNARVGLRPVVTRSWTNLTRHIRGRIGSGRAFNSLVYWQERYAEGGTSGAGSYGRLALFKAEVIR
jgi:hypothetical protein